MKKLILFLGAGIVASMGYSQVVLNIVKPSDISNSLTHAYVDSTAQLSSPSPWTNVPDMTKAYNAVLDTVVLAYDDGTTPASPPATGLAGDSACCGTIINTSEIDGHIALIYRGSCEFGIKAYNAQQAGAKAVIIVNPGGAPSTMGAGTSGFGTQVTIPVTMIGAADGQIMKDAILNGEDVVMYFGPEYGYYGDDLGIPKERMLVARASSIPNAIATNDTEFDVDLGCWVYNYGSNDYIGATVNANVSYNTNSVYNQVSASFDVSSGDSSYVTFPTFSQTTYPDGNYVISYVINHAVADETPENDSVSFEFNINEEYYSLSPLNMGTGEPIKMAPLRIPPDATAGFVSSTSCLVFSDPNASRLAVRGLNFSTATYDPLEPTTLEGEYLEFIVYTWDDVFVDLDDAGFGVNSLNALTQIDYSYDFDDQNEIKTVEFDDAIVLDDNQRYLFCMTSYSENVLIGYDNSISYDLNTETYRQPTTMLNNGTTWYTGFEGTEPTLTLKVLDANAASINENEVKLTPYPNPTSDFITIPMEGLDGEGQLMILDMTGKILSSQTVSVNGVGKMTVDVSNLPAGFYTFNMRFDDGRVSNFNVSVTK